MAQKSKQKGKAGERFFSALLSKHLGGSFVRVPNSGAFLGQSNRSRIADLSASQTLIHRGDIIPPDNLQYLTIECKFYKDFAFHQLLDPNGVAVLDKWIKQSKDDGGEDNIWLLLFKINRRGAFVVFERAQIPQANVGNHVVYQREFVCTEAETFLKENASILRCLGGKSRKSTSANQ